MVMHRIFEIYGQKIINTLTNKIHYIELLARPKAVLKASDIESFFANLNEELGFAWFSYQMNCAEDVYRIAKKRCTVNLDYNVMKVLLHDEVILNSHVLPVVLEITNIQHQQADEPDLFTQVLSKYSDRHHVTWALDDYNLQNIDDVTALLQQKNFTCVKLDYTIVQRLRIDPTGETKRLLTEFRALAREHQVSVIVEGIETAADERNFQQVGYFIFQGFLYHKPEPIRDLIHDLAK